MSDSVQAGLRQMLGAWHKQEKAKGNGAAEPGKCVNGYCSSQSQKPNEKWFCHYLPPAN